MLYRDFWLDAKESTEITALLTSCVETCLQTKKLACTMGFFSVFKQVWTVLMLQNKWGKVQFLLGHGIC